MGEKDLIPITTTERAKELGSKGGKVKSDAKRYAALVTNSKRARCKRCKASCIFKKNNLLQTKDHPCICPEARANAIFYNRHVWDKDVLKSLSVDAIVAMKNKSQSPGQIKVYHDMLMNQWKNEFPNVQQISGEHKVVHLSYEDIKRIYDGHFPEEKE